MASSTLAMWWKLFAENRSRREMIVVRRMQPQDESMVLDVLRRSITELCVADHRNDPQVLGPWLANKTAENFMRWLKDADFFGVVAALDDVLCGVGLLHRSGKISLCYLLPGTQRQGIGTAIYRALEAQACAWGLRALTLESSIEARPFYERLGFRVVAAAGQANGNPAGNCYEKRL